MITSERSPLSAYASRLLASGRVVFSADEAAEENGVSRGAFLDAAERLQRRGRIIRPRRGFYVVVPPKYLTMGAPPPEWFVDALMRHEKRPYYVGLLSAAAAHGAAHPATMEFQVVTDKLLPEITAGRSRIAFSYRKDMAAVAAGIEKRRRPARHVKISSPALTALDLVRYPRAAAGLGNVTAVLSRLTAKLDPEELATLSNAFEKSVVQRLGHLIAGLGHAGLTEAMFAALAERGPLPWVELDPRRARNCELSPPPQRCDGRWRVTERLPASASPQIDA